MRLENGTRFPTVEGTTVDHGGISLPADLDQEWAVVLYYRGHF